MSCICSMFHNWMGAGNVWRPMVSELLASWTTPTRHHFPHPECSRQIGDSIQPEVLSSTRLLPHLPFPLSSINQTYPPHARLSLTGTKEHLGVNCSVWCQHFIYMRIHTVFCLLSCRYGAQNGSKLSGAWPRGNPKDHHCHLSLPS